MLKVDIRIRYPNLLIQTKFEAYEKEIVGLIGSDGSGKSSTLNAISGVREFEGEVEFDGYKYHSIKESEKIKGKIGLMPQGLGLVLYDNLSVKEHIEFFREIKGLKKNREYEEKLLEMAGLEKFLDRFL